MNKINFKNISFKNFMKYGNKVNKVDFNNGLTLITGTNGAGKSSIFIALHYVLFGKTYNGKTLGSLVNNINKKDMLVELELEINDNPYRIIRGTNPNKFEIYKNNELVPVLGTATAYQEYLETSILKLTEQAFKNMIYLGGDLLSQSFVRLSKKEKEEVFSILSDTSIFLELTDKIKTLEKEKVTEQTNETYILNTLTTTLIQTKEQYNTLVEQYNNQKQKQSANTDEIKAKLAECNNKIEQAKQIKSEYDNIDLTELEGKINDLKQKIAKAEASLKIKEKFVLCGDCPKVANFVNMEFNKDELEAEYNKVYSEYNELNTKKQDLLKQLNEIKPFAVMKKEYELLLENTTVINEPSRDVLDLVEKQVKDQEVKINSVNDYISKLRTLKQLLSADNLRGLFLKIHLPFINKTINQYINMFSNFNFNFMLDNTLKETIYKNNKPFEYKSMSNGEALRLTFSIMLAFIDICRNKFNTKCNLLILDEALDSSLDTVGKNELLSILRQQKQELAVYIISHNSEIKSSSTYFDNFITIKNDGKFSSII